MYELVYIHRHQSMAPRRRHYYSNGESLLLTVAATLLIVYYTYLGSAFQSCHGFILPTTSVSFSSNAYRLHQHVAINDKSRCSSIQCKNDYAVVSISKKACKNQSLFASCADNNEIAPELTSDCIERASKLISEALGDGTSNLSSRNDDRYSSARSLAQSFNKMNDDDPEEDSSSSHEQQIIPEHELVYGELGVGTLATIMDAVGVKPNERFLDIGSGDGALTLGAALLYPDYILASRGIELIPGLVDRSKLHLEALREKVRGDDDVLCNVEFFTGDVHQVQSISLNAADKESSTSSSSSLTKLQNILEDTTLAVCFATTWSKGNSKGTTSLGGRKLPKLSSALKVLKKGARVVIIDGKLNFQDGYRWEGDLKIQCPDTAPYSIASLYERV